MAFQIPVTFDTANRKKDKSVTLRFTTNLEVSTDDYMEMDKQLQSEGWLMFAGNPVEEIPVDPAPSKEGKPKGQRLRAVRFLIWQKRGIDEPFDVWYDRWFESLMDSQKEQLE